MPIVHLKGKVLPYNPSAFHVTFKDLSPLTWHDHTTGEDLKINVRINESIVDVEFDVKVFDENNNASLLMRAWDLARGATDLLSFKQGWGLSVIIDTLVKPDGTEATILPKMEILAPYSTAMDSSDPKVNNFDHCYRLLLAEPPLFAALHDLITSITLPNYAATNCARVIEAIRNLIDPGPDRKKAWASMRTNLNVDATYLSYVTDLSTGPRHGDRTWIPGGPITEATTRTWIVMNRFFEFRKRRNNPLPLAEFPLLT